MSSPSSPLPLDEAVRDLVDRVNHSPRAMAFIDNPNKAVAFFCILLDEEVLPVSSSRLGHLLLCAVASGNPLCINKLVAWAKSNHQLPTLSAATLRLLGEGRTGRKLQKMLLDPRCFDATAVLSGPQ